LIDINPEREDERATQVADTLRMRPVIICADSHVDSIVEADRSDAPRPAPRDLSLIGVVSHA